MQDILKQKVRAAMVMVNDLQRSLGESDYQKHLKDLPSNSIGQQIWCLAGARQSYAAAIAEDGDFKWNCTYDYKATDTKASADQSLDASLSLVEEALNGATTLSDNQTSLMLDLLSHEMQHQGQLIRYLYGNRITIPGSWKDFWHLDSQ